MTSDRRQFLEQMTLGAAAIAALDLATPAPLPAQAAGHWDLSWTGRIRGKRRAVFDVPEIEDGFGVWRAIIWKKQYSQMFNFPESALSMVLILRHNAIELAMNQEYWDRYDIGSDKGVKDPVSGEPTKRNPVIERTGAHALPEQFGDFTLESFLEGGGIVLGCALAFNDEVDRIAEKDKVDMQEAERRARSMLVKGVIMQPSGVFAATLAQEYGCRYVRAS
ncbi:MAG TPA: hypothetical protein VFO95_17525 [Gemmatimonadales bacterium]|nr:hypothetical protein [Gemmatimonadales bacterium]